MNLVMDWERTKERWEKWWDGTLNKGPILSVTAPLDKPGMTVLEVKEPQTIKEKWVNIEYRRKTLFNKVMSTWYGGDAVPNCYVDFGPVTTAAFIGSKIEFLPDTVWFHHLENNSFDNIKKLLRYNPENWLWNTIKELIQELIESGKGKYLTTFADFAGPLDILSSLRGNQTLLEDLIESPEEVNECEVKIVELWFRYYEELKKIMDDVGQEGYTCWMPCWSAKTWYPVQSDFSSMISPAMFEKFVIPRLEKQVARLEHSVYHWDGPGQLQHLDYLLSLNNLNAIQWTPGVGQPPPESEEWFSMYKKIVESGKGLVIFVEGKPDKVHEIVNKLPAERLVLFINVESEKEGKEILRNFG